MRTVADLAGVSIASASRVLNGLGGSPELSARVKAAAERVGYVPNAIARSLQAQRTGLIGLAVADIGNPVYVQMMRAIEAEIAGSGRQLLIHATNAHAAQETELLRGLARRYVDGLIMSPLRVTDAHLVEFTRTAVPVVVVGQLPDETPIDNVRANSTAGAGLAVDHLVGLGRRRIAMVNGAPDTIPGAHRDSGFRAALDRHGLAPIDVENGDFTFEAGLAATRRLLSRTRPDAIFAANDLIAAGVLHALLAEGIRVPDEIALVGMDNTDIAELTFPRLTSVDLGAAERGRRAAQLLLSRLDDPSLPARRESIAPSLVRRDSA
ncbi:MAG: LacI family DNA-binding transcriptional regulator [Hamadaea sp.]|nr:LacI family DNA-binding transcriptional regulator [Hamadaea sp.]